MRNARFVFALLVVAGAALAACSGNFGAGTSAPGGLLPSGPLSGVAATASPTPSSASNIVTYGDSAAFQPLPQAAGYGGAIAFEVPSPRPSGFQAVPIGATLAITAPDGSPNINLTTPGKRGKKRERPARALAYLSLLPTRDVTLASYPRIAIDVPRDIATAYRVEEINLALYNSGANDKIYRMAVAEHDVTSPPPTPTPGRTAPPPPTPIAVGASPVAGASGVPTALPSGVPTALPSGALTPPPSGALTPPPVVPGGGVPPLPPSAAPSVSPTLPPQRILFAAAPTALKLTANKAVIFAVYALPVATPSPSPSPAASGSAAAGSSPVPAGSGSPSAAGASPAATSSPAAAPSPLGTSMPATSGASIAPTGSPTAVTSASASASP